MLLEIGTSKLESGSRHLISIMALLESLYLPLLAICLAIAFSMRFLNKSQQDALLSIVHLTNRGRRSSSSDTPPRSLSPEKKSYAVSGPSNPADYKNIFPPSTRETLPHAAKTSQQKKALRGSLVDEIVFRKNIIPFEADFRECGPSTYTPMELSLGEVEALGDFPDYSALSGVPSPEPYRNFHIETALPRPYRPFRWAYHQTMCKYTHN